MRPNDIKHFILDERSSVTKATYTQFLENNSNNIDSEITKDFADRLLNKSLESSEEVSLVMFKNNQDRNYVALVKSLKTNKYYYVEAEYEHSKITKYSVRTYYDFR